MEQFLPAGEQYIRRALLYSMQSPFTFSSNQSAKEIEVIYKDAIDFAIGAITGKGNTPSGIETSSFKQVFVQMLEEVQDTNDEQDKLIVLDYLFIDYILYHHKLTSTQIKSAICAYELIEGPVVQGQIQKVVESFK